MDGYVLPAKAKLVALSAISSRYFLDSQGVLCLRVGLTSGPGAEVEFVRLDGSWRADVVRAIFAGSSKKYVDLNVDTPTVRVNASHWGKMHDAEAGSLILSDEGFALVAGHWNELQGRIAVNLGTGQRQELVDLHAMIITDWSIDAWFGETKAFEIGGQSAVEVVG